MIRPPQGRFIRQLLFFEPGRWKWNVATACIELHCIGGGGGGLREAALSVQTCSIYHVGFFVFFVYKSKFKKIMGLGRRGGEGGNFTGVIPDIALFCCSGGGGACRRRGGIESCRRRGDSSSGGSNTCNVRSRDGIYGGKEGGKEGSGEVGEGIYIY